MGSLPAPWAAAEPQPCPAARGEGAGLAGGGLQAHRHLRAKC